MPESTIPNVCFVTDVAKALRTSRSTIDKLRRHGCFPIREMPSIDKRPRWSGASVQQFIESGRALTVRRRR